MSLGFKHDTTDSARLGNGHDTSEFRGLDGVPRVGVDQTGHREHCDGTPHSLLIQLSSAVFSSGYNIANSTVYSAQQNHFFRQDQAALPGSQLDAYYSRRRFSEKLITPPRKKQAARPDSASSGEEEGNNEKRQRRTRGGDGVRKASVKCLDEKETGFDGGNESTAAQVARWTQVDVTESSDGSGSELSGAPGTSGTRSAHQRRLGAASPASGTKSGVQPQQHKRTTLAIPGTPSKASYQLKPGSAEHGQQLALERAEAAAEAAMIPEERAGKRSYCAVCKEGFPNKDALVKHVGRCTGKTSPLKGGGTFGSARVRKTGPAGGPSGNSGAGGRRTMKDDDLTTSGRYDEDGVARDEMNESADDDEGSSEKVYNCTQCSMIFSQRSALKCHVRAVHQKQRPFKCDLCDSTFGHKGDLNRHRMIKHERLRPFRCDICHASFGRKSVLNRHSEKLHGIRPPPSAQKPPPNKILSVSTTVPRTFPPRIAPNPHTAFHSQY